MSIKKILKTRIFEISGDKQREVFNDFLLELINNNKNILSLQYNTSSINLPIKINEADIKSYFTGEMAAGYVSETTGDDGEIREKNHPFAIHCHFVMITWEDAVGVEGEEVKVSVDKQEE